MIVQWEGRDWQYSDRAVTVSMCRIIKKETGLRWPTEFGEAIGEMDPDAIAALMWLVKTQNGMQVTIEAMDGSPLDFLDAYGKALTADMEKDPPDPSTPAPAGGSGPTTSETSETST